MNTATLDNVLSELRNLDAACRCLSTILDALNSSPDCIEVSLEDDTAKAYAFVARTYGITVLELHTAMQTS